MRNVARSAQADLTDREQVRGYLNDRVKERFSKAVLAPEGVQITRIEDVPYRGLGYVFEPQKGIVHPPLERVEPDDNGEIEYCAVFWANLWP
ncbi:hypothetical protein OKW49_008036 [Paraburkholderia youngii]|uniref:hypothetical protein n=1 Tax=Paraburkholderia youngii TaxID=2782701 RepID=UPI003D19F8B3